MPPRQSAANPTHTAYLLENLSLGLYLEGSGYSAPEGTARVANNIIFNEDGSFTVRPGRVVVATLGEPGIRYFKQFTRKGVLHTLSHVGNTLYDDSTAVLTLPDGAVVNAVEVLDKLLISVNSTLYEYSDSLTVPIQAKLKTPEGTISTATTGGTIAAGSYSYKAAFLYDNGTEGPATDALTVSTSGSTSTITVSVTNPGDARIKFVRYYRKLANDPTYLLAATLETYSFTETALTSLAAETHQLDVSEMVGGIMLWSSGRLYTFSNGRLYYSHPGEPRTRSAFFEEPITLPESDTVTALVPLGTGVALFGSRNAMYLTASPVEGGSLVPLNVSDGIVNQHAWANTPQGLVFLGTYGLWLMQQATPVKLSQGVGPLTTALNDAFSSLAFWPSRNSIIAGDVSNCLVGGLFEDRARFSTWDIRPSHVEEYQGDFYYSQDNAVYKLQSDQDQNPTSAIKFQFETNPLSMGDASLSKLFRRAEMFFTGGGKTTVVFGIRPVMGEDTGLQTADASINTVGTTWLNAVWGIATWGSPSQAKRNRLVLSSSVVAQYAVVRLEGNTNRQKQFNVFAPIQFDLRIKDRLGRNR